MKIQMPSESEEKQNLSPVKAKKHIRRKSYQVAKTKTIFDLDKMSAKNKWPVFSPARAAQVAMLM